jgi:crotonobetainyl-CoA:carnitine CoA-transferase CaiB-like acyl-CoA transferase
MDMDPRFASQESRTQHAEEIGRFLGTHLLNRTNRDWLTLCNELDIPACPVNSIEDLFEDPHLKAVDFFEDVEHPSEGALKNCRFPINFSRTPASVQRLAPTLGEHDAEVFLSEPPSGADTTKD